MALVPPMLPQPLALACAWSRAARGDPTGRGPRDIELRLASARPHVPSRPFMMPGSFLPASRNPPSIREQDLSVLHPCYFWQCLKRSLHREGLLTKKAFLPSLLLCQVG